MNKMNNIYYKVLLHLHCRPVTSPLLSAGIQTHQLSYTHVSIFYDCHRIGRRLCLCFIPTTDRKKLVIVLYSLCIFATGSKGPCVSLLTRVILKFCHTHMSAYSMTATGSKEACVCVLFFVYSCLRDRVRSSCRIALLSVIATESKGACVCLITCVILKLLVLLASLTMLVSLALLASLALQALQTTLPSLPIRASLLY